MDVLGAFVKVSDGRYLAGFALVQGTTLAGAWSFPAPSDGDEAVQLGELNSYAFDLIQQYGPEAVSVKGTEAGSAKAQAVSHHGEGSILAAAGRAGKPGTVWTGPGYRAAVGAPNNAGALKVAERKLGGEWPAATEVQQAAAAALAWIQKHP